MEQSYKEKYEQAIERLKQWDREHPCDGYVLSDRDKFIFPELAESEDEKAIKEIIELVMQPIWKTEKEFHRRNELCAWIKKQGQVKESFISQHENRTCEENGNSLTYDDEKVRNTLIDFFGRGAKYGGQTNGVYDKDIIAWLEKQGEKLPAGFYYVNSEGKKFYSDTFKYGGDVILHVEKQGEQKSQRTISAEAKEAMYDKPADTVEPKFKVGDKIYLKPEYRMPNDDTPIANTVKEIRRIDDKHYRFDGSYIFIEDQDKYALVEQKPAWSEEDEQRLNSCLNILQPKTFVGNTETRNTKWLKSLKGRVQPQPKQEWNEEDEQHIDSLLKRLDALCRNKFERTRFAISEDRDWLKSLRPLKRWKPSDEQIKVCKEVYADILSAKGFDLGTVVSELNRMEEELKKLKEEQV